MTVDVLYEGLTIAKAAPARAEGDGLFVELEAPMPVGTRLLIRGGGAAADRPARVERVHEGVGPGVLLRFGAAPAKAEAKPEAKVESKPAAPVEAKPTNGEADDDADEPDPKKGGSGGRRQKKKSKTVIGH